MERRNFPKAYNGQLDIWNATGWKLNRIKQFINDVVDNPQQYGATVSQNGELAMIRDEIFNLIVDGPMYKDPTLQPASMFARRVADHWERSQIKKRQDPNRDTLMKMDFVKTKYRGLDYFHAADYLALFLSVISPPPADATRSNFFTPLTVMYCAWLLEVCGGERKITPNVNCCVWTVKENKPVRFFLGSNAVHRIPERGIQGVGKWLDQIRRSRYGVMDSTVMSELGMTIQSILPGEDPERATTYGQCAETYPFMHIIREYDPKTETVFGLSIDGSLRSMTKHWRQEWVNQAKRTLCGHCMSLIRHFNWDPKNFNLTDEQIKHADNRRPVEKQPRLKRANEDPKESEKIKRPRTPSLEPVPIQEIIMKKEAIGLAPPRSEEQEEEWIAPHHRPCPSFNMPSQSSYSHVEPGILHYPSGIVFGPTSESTSETEPQVPKVHPQGLTSDQVAQQMAELAERMGVSPRPVIPFPASPGYQDDQPPADPSEISQRPPVPVVRLPGTLKYQEGQPPADPAEFMETSPVPVVRLPGTLKYQEGQPPADPAEFMETSPVPVVRLPGTLKYQEGQPPADPAEFMESSQDIAVRLPGSTSEQETQRTGEEHLVEDDGEQAVQSQSDGRRKGKGRNEEGRGKEVGDSNGAQGKSGRSGEKKEKKNKKKGGWGRGGR